MRIKLHTQGILVNTLIAIHGTAAVIGLRKYGSGMISSDMEWPVNDEQLFSSFSFLLKGSAGRGRSSFRDG
jgi:hypothetical protein